MPKIDYKTRDLIFSHYGEQGLAEFEALTYADRYLYKQYILRDMISPSEWKYLQSQKALRGKYDKFSDKHSEFNVKEIAKELGVSERMVYLIYNSALKKIYKFLRENPQKYKILREYFEDLQ